MDSNAWQRIQDVFHAARHMPETERSLFVEKEAAGNSEIAEEVFEMLAALCDGASRLDRPPARDVVSFDSAPVEQFHPYRVTGEIGRGGMGVVLKAERENGQPVAIKVLEDSWISPERRRRFAIEQQALGKLEHPYIARLYHADTLAGGTPWFAMEYIGGLRLDSYCRERACAVAELLRLFRCVCEAVEHAHKFSIVHRDLKPSNILVTPDGIVKLIDFGIAKQLNDPLESVTCTGMRFMTLPYAAPEQIGGGQIGTWTDVYSLGVILYELLAGRPPYDVSGRSPAEAAKLLTDQTPQKPSAVARAAGRFALAGKSAWSDLDCLCLRAIEKNPTDRYGSVGDLIRDVDHYLKNEPLETRPHSFVYRSRKFLVRNRRGVLAASAALLALLGLAGFDRLRLRKARDAALLEAERTERVSRFMFDLFEGGDKESGPANDLRVMTVIDRGFRQAQNLRSDPVVQAQLYETLGNVYRALGNLDRADLLLRAALEKRRSILGPDNPEVSSSLLSLGILRIDQGRLPEAESLIRAALTMDSRRLPAGYPPPAHDLAALARVFNERGQYEQSIRLLSRAIPAQPTGAASQADVVSEMINLADAHFYLAHYSAADSLNRRAMAIHRKVYGDNHPLVAEDLINLGEIQTNIGHYVEAESDFRKALAINQAWYGGDHPKTARNLTYLAQALDWQGRYEETRPMLESALATSERAYGKNSPKVALVLNQLGIVDAQTKKFKAAEADYQRTLEIYRAVYGEYHQFTAMAMNNLATIYLKEQQNARAEQLFRSALRIQFRVLPAGHLNVGVARVKLGRALLRERRYMEAEKESRAGYDIISRQASPSINWLVEARKDLISEYQALKQPGEAANFRSQLAGLRKQ